jgi:hypothetical protein
MHAVESAQTLAHSRVVVSQVSVASLQCSVFWHPAHRPSWQIGCTGLH